MDILAKLDIVTNSKVPDFRTGDSVRVHQKIVEGDKQRVQIFEGVVLKRKRAGLRSMITVRKNSFGVGVEKDFPVHSPLIEKIEIVTSGRVRRSRLYYLRELSGKSARIRERRRDTTTADANAEAAPSENTNA